MVFMQEKIRIDSLKMGKESQVPVWKKDYVKRWEDFTQWDIREPLEKLTNNIVVTHIISRGKDTDISNGLTPMELQTFNQKIKIIICESRVILSTLPLKNLHESYFFNELINIINWFILSYSEFLNPFFMETSSNFFLV